MAIGDTNSVSIQIRNGKLYVNGERWTSDIYQDINANQIKLGETLFGITGNYVRPNEPNLVASNIKSGVSIYGVTGNLESTKVDFGTIRVTGSSTSQITFSHNLGKEPEHVAVMFITTDPPTAQSGNRVLAIFDDDGTFTTSSAPSSFSYVQASATYVKTSTSVTIKTPGVVAYPSIYFYYNNYADSYAYVVW